MLRATVGQRRRVGEIALLVLGLLGVLLSPAHPEHIVVGCIGDYGRGSGHQAKVARLVKSWRPDLVITVGDNNYPNGAAETIDAHVGQFYHEFISPYQGRYGQGARRNQFFPSLGNHDWYTAGARPYLEYFTLPGNERYYTFTRGPVEFFCVDSDKSEPDGVTSDSAQGEWLRAQLSRSKAPWKVVYFHHAPYTSGYWHGSHTGETDYMRWPFKQWGANVIVSGHDHIYERLHVEGLTYFVNGLGGDSWDWIRMPALPQSRKQFTGEFGALRLDATETNMTLRFVTVKQRIIDTHVILKESAAHRLKPLQVSIEVQPD